MNRRAFMRTATLAAAATAVGVTGVVTTQPQISSRVLIPYAERFNPRYTVGQRNETMAKMWGVYPIPFNVELWLSRELLLDSAATESLIRHHILNYSESEFKPSMGAILINFFVYIGCGARQYSATEKDAWLHGFCVWKNEKHQVTQISFAAIWSNGEIRHLPYFDFLSAFFKANATLYGRPEALEPEGALAICPV